jgi:REP element-mobilizing transposase RayT
MPDHLHLLVEGREESSDCKDFIKRAKQYSGFYYRRQYGRRLWQRYSYEHVLRDHQKSVNAARYIMRNPVAAGLVARAESYPYSGSLELSRDALIAWTIR